MDDEIPRRIALVVHPERDDARELAGRARRWWEASDFEVVVYSELDPSADGALPDGGVRFAVSLGGDGTLLHTVQLVAGSPVPILGVNLGHLGYLTQVEPSAMEVAFEHLRAGTFSVEERMTLNVLAGPSELLPDRYRGAGMEALPDGVHRLVGLNEASLEKTAPGHTIRFSLEVAGRPFLTYAADGVLVATPTGSTAYNLSLRGPLLSPELRVLVVTPIAPHMLFDRSLVLAADQAVRLRLLERRPALLVVDGGAVATLGEDDAVLLSAGSEPVRIVRFGGHHFVDVLRHKFNLFDR